MEKFEITRAQAIKRLREELSEAVLRGDWITVAGCRAQITLIQRFTAPSPAGTTRLVNQEPPSGA